MHCLLHSIKSWNMSDIDVQDTLCSECTQQSLVIANWSAHRWVIYTRYAIPTWHWHPALICWTGVCYWWALPSKVLSQLGGSRDNVTCLHDPVTLFTTELVVKGWQADSKSLESVHWMPIVHGELVLGNLQQCRECCLGSRISIASSQIEHIPLQNGMTGLLQFRCNNAKQQ